MKTLFRSILVTSPLFAVLTGGCATTDASKPASLTNLKSNTAYVGPDGTVIVKGFGGRYTANFVCVLPSGSYRIVVDTKREGKANIEAKETVKVGGEGKTELNAELSVIYKPEDRMLALQQIMGNACVMLGNGLFGDTCTKVVTPNPKGLPPDDEKYCSGPAPEETLKSYNKFVQDSIAYFDLKEAKEAEVRKAEAEAEARKAEAEAEARKAEAEARKAEAEAGSKKAKKNKAAHPPQEAAGGGTPIPREG